MVMHDSGKRQQFASGAVRDTAEDKPRPELISPYFTDRLANHLMLGAVKYDDDNWAQGIPMRRCVASLERHLIAFKKGLTDEDHLAAIACNIMFLIHNDEMHKDGCLPDDLWDMPDWQGLISRQEDKEESFTVCSKCELPDPLCGCSKIAIQAAATVEVSETDPKPCPYCGCEGVVCNAAAPEYYVYCDGPCNMEGPVEKNKKDAIIAWNYITIPVVGMEETKEPN